MPTADRWCFLPCFIGFKVGEKELKMVIKSHLQTFYIELWPCKRSCEPVHNNLKSGSQFENRSVIPFYCCD